MAEYPNLAAGISRAFIQDPGVTTKIPDAQIARTAKTGPKTSRRPAKQPDRRPRILSSLPTCTITSAPLGNRTPETQSPLASELATRHPLFGGRSAVSAAMNGYISACLGACKCFMTFFRNFLCRSARPTTKADSVGRAWHYIWVFPGVLYFSMPSPGSDPPPAIS